MHSAIASPESPFWLFDWFRNVAQVMIKASCGLLAEGRRRSSAATAGARSINGVSTTFSRERRGPT
jgi:hypothetical protein